MSFNISLLIALLLSSILFIPVLYVVLQRLRAWQIEEELKTTLRYWLYFILSILGLRVLIGFLLMVTGAKLFGVDKFYPIRIAYPNYDLLQGIPYLLACLAVLLRLGRIRDFIIESRWKYILLWVFAVVLLLSFGGIHGGLISGNVGIANSSEHLADATLNKTVAEVFANHTDRVAGRIKPSYQAPHSTSHPAGSIAYWQILVNNTTPFVFSVINVLVFAFAFPVMYWALRRRYDNATAFQGVMACLFIPAVLIYGRSDDAVYYFFACVIISLVSIALHEYRYGLTFGAAGVLVGAMNFSYASVVLLPAALSFNTNTSLAQVWRYLGRATPHVLIFVGIVWAALVMEMWATSYNWLDAFSASVHYNHGSTIVSMLKNGNYARVINDRVMAIYDFLIFAGPLFLYLFVQLVRNCSQHIGAWQFKNISLVLLLCALAINSNGPGEVSRPWGSLFLIIGFFWLPEFLRQENEKTRWLLIRAQFAWALILQAPLNFGW